MEGQLYIHAWQRPPTAVDTNLDGYVDKVYIGDLKGTDVGIRCFKQMNTTKKRIALAGKRLFKPRTKEKHPIYYPPAVAFDTNGIPWVYFGTGDRENPNDKNNQERFYAVKDDGNGDYPYRKKGFIRYNWC